MGRGLTAGPEHRAPWHREQTKNEKKEEASTSHAANRIDRAALRQHGFDGVEDVLIIAGGSVGASLYAQALEGGGRGTQQPVGALRLAAPDAVEAGSRADFLLLDDSAPELVERAGSAVLDSWIFSGNRNLVREVWVAGTRVVAAGRHLQREQLQLRYRSALRRLQRV